MAKVTVLGGSAAGVGTGQGCSAYLVDSGSEEIVLDLGPNTLLELRRHTNFRTLAALVLSHLHLDHMLDVFALRFSLTYNPIKPEQKLPLWAPPGGVAFFQQAAKLFADKGEAETFLSDVFEISEYDPDAKLAIGQTTLTFRPTVHYVPCWAIRLHHPDAEGDLVYTADTGPATRLEDFAAGARTVIAEATLLEERDEPWRTRGHLTAAEAAQLAASAGAQDLVITHIWEENGPEQFVEQAKQHFGGTVTRATPGATVAW